MSADSGRTAFTVRGPIDRGDVQGLCDRVRELSRHEAAAVVWCDVAGLPADAVTVDALAALQLAARRRECRIRLRNASSELLDLVAFTGLTEALGE